MLTYYIHYNLDHHIIRAGNLGPKLMKEPQSATTFNCSKEKSEITRYPFVLKASVQKWQTSFSLGFHQLVHITRSLPNCRAGNHSSATENGHLELVNSDTMYNKDWWSEKGV